MKVFMAAQKDCVPYIKICTQKPKQTGNSSLKTQKIENIFSLRKKIAHPLWNFAPRN
jgi:hypothetical protein